jgi:hypothetical protein
MFLNKDLKIYVKVVYNNIIKSYTKNLTILLI